MEQLDFDDAEQAGGGMTAAATWVWNDALGQAVSYVIGAALRGEIDYASVAAQQDHYYNTVGA